MLNYSERKIRLPMNIVAIILIVLIFTAITLTATTVVTVEVGYVTIVIDPINKSMWTEGDGTYAGILFFKKPPWAYTKKVYVAVDKLEMWTEENMIGDYPAISCLTKDGLAVEVDILIRWRVDPNKVLDLYKNYPNLNWKMTTIASIVREVVRNVIANYTALQTIEKRSEIGTIIFNEIDRALKQDKTLLGAIILEETDLREIALPKKFTDAIEDKLAAEQEMLAAQYRAAAIIITTQAQANATLIMANATAEAIALIAEKCDLNATEIAQLYLLIEALKDIAETNENTIFLVIVGQDGQYILPLDQLKS